MSTDERPEATDASGGPDAESVDTAPVRRVRSPRPAGHHAPPPPPSGWAGLRRALRPHKSASQVLVGILCAVLGFALVVQLGQNHRDRFASLRQSDLVRMLDDVTTRGSELESQVEELRSTRDALAASAERERVAAAKAKAEAQTQGILSGRLGAQGPGVTIDITGSVPPANVMVNVLEELRNAGAEAIEINGVRLVTDSYFVDSDGGLTLDGAAVSMPLHVTAIGEPSTIDTALRIPKGAVDALAEKGAQTAIAMHDLVQVTATIAPPDPQYATPTK